MGAALTSLKQDTEESYVVDNVVPPQPPPLEQSQLMSPPPNQPQPEQSKPEPTDLPTNNPGSDSPEAKPGSESPEATKQPEKEESKAEATDLPNDKPGSESSEAEKEEEGEEEDEEEGECGFCLFMKGGGCKEPFVDWENCVKEAEEKDEDLVEKCGQVTARLKQCMDAHSEYYEPILRAEKHAEEQVTIELEKEEKAKKDSESEKAAAEHSDQK